MAFLSDLCGNALRSRIFIFKIPPLKRASPCKKQGLSTHHEGHEGGASASPYETAFTAEDAEHAEKNINRQREKDA
jgi:hypothetical protein